MQANPHDVETAGPALVRPAAKRRLVPGQARYPRTTRAAVTPIAGSVRLVAEACLGDLPDAYRAVIELRDFEDCPVPEVARRLSLSVALVTARLERARRLLALALCRRSQTARVTRSPG